MTTFHLPDLGEGLPDAEITEWHVKVGDTIKVDDPLVSMETAKAVVDVPSPYAGTITHLHGKPGDIIKTGAPLVDFTGGASVDEGTVVGKIDASGTTLTESFIVGSSNSANASTQPLATPRVKQLAKKLQVSLTDISPTGPNGIITVEDVERSAANAKSHTPTDTNYVPLRGPRRQMSLNMTLAHQQVVPVTLFDDADIAHWDANVDITTKIIQAIISACQSEPSLNAWFDGKSQSILTHQQVDLGIAMDTGDALFVPVIKGAETKSQKELREMINRFKQGVRERNLSQEELQGATITLSNFGNFAGRYANPVIVPPTVAILGVGRIYNSVVASANEMVSHKMLPLSLSFDHRAATGGEASRFLGKVIEVLQSNNTT